MQVKQIMLRHEQNWKDEALLIQECFHFNVLLICVAIIVQLGLVEVSLSIEKIVNIISQIPLWEMMLKVKFTKLEWFIAIHWEHVIMINCCIDDILPDFWVDVCAEKHVINEV